MRSNGVTGSSRMVNAYPGMYCMDATSIVAAVSPSANQKSGMPTTKFSRKMRTICSAENKATMMVVYMYIQRHDVSKKNAL